MPGAGSGVSMKVSCQHARQARKRESTISKFRHSITATRETAKIFMTMGMVLDTASTWSFWTRLETIVLFGVDMESFKPNATRRTTCQDPPCLRPLTKTAPQHFRALPLTTFPCFLRLPAPQRTTGCKEQLGDQYGFDHKWAPTYMLPRAGKPAFGGPLEKKHGGAISRLHQDALAHEEQREAVVRLHQREVRARREGAERPRGSRAFLTSERMDLLGGRGCGWSSPKGVWAAENEESQNKKGIWLFKKRY